jgi:hypothetical protein
MESSLVLLQELMCWSLQDITYLNQNERKDKERNKMTSATRFVKLVSSAEQKRTVLHFLLILSVF